MARVVCEPHVIEGDRARDLIDDDGMRAFRDDRVNFEQRTNALHTNPGLCDRRGHLCQILDRFEKFPEIGEKDGQRAGGHGASKNQSGPAPQDD
jgi:hypothetical protein